MEQTLIQVRPSQRQIDWQQMEFYGFIHFGMNTFNNIEWGLGHEAPALFNPQNLDAEQWVLAAKQAEMTGLILTCKHHDGFCLWPSDHSTHTVAQSPWREGRGDLVREVAEACDKHGLKLGIYLSPWDRTEATYGRGAEYDAFYLAQLRELLTNYGEIFSVWLDGANGEEEGKKQSYDWQRYYEMIRDLQPQAVISVCGPDVRWCGNEAGQTRAEEWSVVPSELQNPDYTAAHSQQVDDGEFVSAIDWMAEDLGSRQALRDYNGQLAWYPAEVNTSIRPGWFYHEEEDERVRSAAELFDIYKESVGGNATFLLNLPPTKEGLIHSNDQAVLKGLGNKIRQFKEQLQNTTSTVTVSSGVATEVTTYKANDDYKQYWQAEEVDVLPWLVLEFTQEQQVNGIVIREAITHGQRCETIDVYYRQQGQWSKISECGAVGYQKIIEFPTIQTDAIKLSFRQYRGKPAISFVSAVHF